MSHLDPVSQSNRSPPSSWTSTWTTSWTSTCTSDPPRLSACPFYHRWRVFLSWHSLVWTHCSTGVLCQCIVLTTAGTFAVTAWNFSLQLFKNGLEQGTKTGLLFYQRASLPCPLDSDEDAAEGTEPDFLTSVLCREARSTCWFCSKSTVLKGKQWRAMQSFFMKSML